MGWQWHQLVSWLVGV